MKVTLKSVNVTIERMKAKQPPPLTPKIYILPRLGNVKKYTTHRPIITLFFK